MAKAYLKGTDSTLFHLREVTSVGSGKCDFVIQHPGVDLEHCKIDYSEQDGCYVLQDMNTSQGTYVNEVRVQNAAVRLAAGDLIRFGYSGQTYELVLENDSQLNTSPLCQKSPVWGQQQILFPNTEPYSSCALGGVQTLPHIASMTSFSHNPTTWAHFPTCTLPPAPRPPLRSRPLSAGAARRNVQNLSAYPSNNGGYVRPVDQPLFRVSSIPDLQDKDQKISQLNQEVIKLRSIELEGMHKDTLIQQLHQEIADLRNKIPQDSSYILGVDRDMSSKLLYLETEVRVKKEEIATLKEQINKLQDDKAPVRQELGERIREISQLRTELECVKKDKGITAGLITQMQRDMSNKDSTISRLIREIEVQKKEIREKDAQISSARHAKDVAKAAEENSAREKEMIALRQKFKTTENKLQEHQNTITALRAEADKTKSQLLLEKDTQLKIQNDLDNVRAQFQDFQRSEKVVRMNLEQIQKKSERLRSRVIQLTFSTSALKPPQKEISDDELTESLKKLIDERAELLVNIKAAEAWKWELLKHTEKVRENLESCAHRLKENGRLSKHLEKELTITESLTVNENLNWMCDLFSEMLKAELCWENSIETVLTRCGANINISNDNPGLHIQMLYNKLESSLTEIEQLQNKIQTLEADHKAELELKLKIMETEMEERIKDAVQETKFKGQQELNVAIDEIKTAEEKKREDYVEIERKKARQLESLLAELKKSFDEQHVENEARLAETSQVFQELETLKVAEKLLKENMKKLEQQLIDQAVEFKSQKEELVKKSESNQTSYEEQIKQHSVTICAMEEKLTKLVKEKKGVQDQLNKLKCKPVVPPKVIVQKPREEIIALEHVVNVLRQENAVLKKDIMDAQDVIMGLRRDLSGVAAQISDISGEMSESQKQEVERSRELLNQKGGELNDLRQQMVKLSKIIDSQKEEIQKLEEELSKEKTVTKKYKYQLEENNDHVEKLKDELQREKVEQKKQLELIESEGRITSELTSLGAQCRGERHEHVIARQREALVELRAKIKILEQLKPSLSTEDEAIQKIMHLQKELAELRKNQALAENMYIQERTCKGREIARTRGLSSNAEAEMERSAHLETMDALECSEASYLSLCRSLADSLHIEGMGGLSSLAHIPRDERELVIEARRQACQLLASHIESLRERLARKDALLEDYESQLAQLKTSIVLEEQRNQELENLKNNIQCRAEESDYLRESLTRARENLNQEKKLNSSIKDRKQYRHHHCKVEDPQEEVRKKQHNELIKRKNYEIKKLKKVLSDTEKVLHDSHRARNLDSHVIVHAQKCGSGCNGCPECRELQMVTGAQ